MKWVYSIRLVYEYGFPVNPSLEVLKAARAIRRLRCPQVVPALPSALLLYSLRNHL